MKVKTGPVIGMAMTLASTLPITAVAANPPSPTVRQTVLAAAICPAGMHWEAAGYVRGGRWNAAHCVGDQAPHS